MHHNKQDYYYKKIFCKISKMLRERVKKNVTAITFYSPSCLGQETAKGPFGLRVELSPANLSTTHGGGITLHVPIIAERQAKNAVVADVLSTRPLIDICAVVHWSIALMRKNTNFCCMYASTEALLTQAFRILTSL